MVAPITTWSQVLIIAPELNTTGPPDLTNPIIQNVFLQDAANAFSMLSKYGNRLEEIQRYAAAHYASLSLKKSYGGGSLQNQSIGGVSISYVPPAPRAMKPWTETQYGRRVFQIIQQSIPTGIIATPAWL